MSSNPWDLSALYGGGTATGGGNPWDLSSQYAAPAAVSQAGAPQPQGLLGGLLHMPLALVGGLKDFAVGIGQLGGALEHDIFHGVAQAIPGRQDWGVISDNPNQHYLSPQIAENLVGYNTPGNPGFHPMSSPLVQDYVNRYGPAVHSLEQLATGHPMGYLHDASRFFKGVEQQPLSFIVDAGMVTGAAAKGAEVGADAAIAANPEAAAAKAATLSSLLGSPEGGITTGVKEAQAMQAATRAGLDSLASQGELNPVQSLLRHALPSETFSLASGGPEAGTTFVPGVAARNPILRASESLLKRMTSDTIPFYQSKLADMNAGLAAHELAHTTPMAADIFNRDLLAATLKKAENLGITRIPNKTQSAITTWQRVGKVVTDSSWLTQRLLDAKPYQDDIAATLDKAPEVANTYHLTSRGVDVSFTGLTPDSNIAARVEAAGLPTKQVSLDVRALEPVGQGSLGFYGDAPQEMAKVPLAPITNAKMGELALTDAQHALQGTNLAERTMAIQDQLDQFISERTANKDFYDALGWNTADQIDSAQVLQRQLSEGLTRLANDASGKSVVPEGVKMQDRLRILDLEKRVPLFEVGRSSPTSYLNHTMDALRMKYGGGYEGLNAVGGPDVKAMERAISEAGISAPTYFPSIEAENLANGDFFRTKPLTGVRKNAMDKSEKQSLGIVFRKGTEITNPYDAWTRRAARATRFRTSLELHDALIKNFGMKWDRRAPGGGIEEAPPGWKLASLDAIHIAHGSHLQFQDTVDKLISQGMGREEAWSKAITEAGNTALTNIEHAAARTKGPNPDVYIVPAVVAKRLDEAANLSKVFGGQNVRLFWDKPLQVWRSFVLTGSPRWVVNNTLGNMTFAVMQGVKLRDAMKILGERMRAMLVRWIGNPDAFGGAFIHDSGLANDIRRLAEDPNMDPNSFLNASIRPKTLAGQVQRLPGWENVGSGYAGNTASQYNPHMSLEEASTKTGRAVTRYQESSVGRGLANYATAVKGFNAQIESAFRDASYLTAAEKAVGKSNLQRWFSTFWDAKKRVDGILGTGFDEAHPQRIMEALNSVNHFFGRFDNLSPLERNVVRRFLFPFWGFYRFQINLLVRFPFENPVRYSVIKQLGNANADMMKVYGPLPDWLQGATPLGPPGATVPFSSNRGPDPFSGTFTDWTSQLSPVVKMAIERATGRSLFSGKPFTDPNVITPFGSSQAFRIVRDASGKPVDAVPITGHVLPSPVEQALSQIPQYQTIKSILAGGATYDTAGITSVLPGTSKPGLIKNAQGQAKYPTTSMAEIAKLFGFPSTSYDLGAYQSSLAQARQNALNQAIKAWQAETGAA